MVVNDGPGLSNYLKPFFQYRYSGPEAPFWSFEAMTAYKQNRAVIKHQFHKKWAWYARGDIEIANDGDSPSVDGKDFNDFEFKAHSYRGLLGMDFKNEIAGIPLHAQLSSSGRYFQIYKKSDTTLMFTNPKNFFEGTLHLRLDTGPSQPSTELADFGFRTTCNVAVFRRTKNNLWGVIGTRKKIDHYGKASLGLRISEQLWKPVLVVAGVQGSSTIGKTDRLSAIRSGQFAQRDESLFVSSVRALRVISGDLGFRFYFEDEGIFAIRPFAYAVAYRELLPTNDQRNDAAFGGGMKLMGRIQKTIFTDLTYAIGRGNRPDLKNIHQVKYSLLARF